MTQLTVALPLVRPTAGTEFSYVASEDGHTPGAHGSAALALLPPADSVVLVVPARALSWHLVKLPPLPAGRQRAALEGLLEDRLLDEPATLAFALAPERRPDGNTLVAVCERDWLAGVLQLFEQGGRPASRVVPELAPLAGADPAQQQLVASGTPDEAWLAVVDASAVVSVPLTQARSLWATTDGQAPQAVELSAEPAVADLAEHLVGRPATVRSVPQALLASARSPWELAQFDLATSGRGRLARRGAQAWSRFARGPRWRAARWGLVAAVVANLVGLNAWAWRLDATLLARRAEVRQVLTQTFPKVRTVVDAPRQMERELALLRQSSGALSARDLESMLSALGSAAPQDKYPTALEFSAGQLSARGLGLDAAQRELVTGKLSAQGYVAQHEGDRLSLRHGGRP